MSREATRSPGSAAIARRLVSRAVAEAPADPALVAASLHETCARVLANLRDALGDEGCNALLARALARSEVEHPALKKIRRLYGDSIHLDGVAATVETLGAPAVTAAIEALLAALVDVLGRLIGEDMAVRLIDADGHRAGTNGEVKP